MMYSLYVLCMPKSTCQDKVTVKNQALDIIVTLVRRHELFRSKSVKILKILGSMKAL